MHILPVRTYNPYNNKINYKNAAKTAQYKAVNNYDQIPYYTYQALFFTGKQSKTNKTDKIKNQQDTQNQQNYDNLDEFYTRFVDKIDKQLMNPTMDDLDALIDEIEFETKAPKQLILETLFRLTQFSSYSSIECIESYLKKYNANANYDANSFDINRPMYYLLNNLYNIMTCKRTNSALFLDDIYIKNLKKNKGKIEPGFYNTYNQPIKFFILDGFNVRTKNNKYMGANFLQGTQNLKEIAIHVIHQVQQGSTLDDALNGDIKSKFLKICPDKKDDLVVIKNKIPNKKNIKTKILKNLRSKNINEQHLDYEFNYYAEAYEHIDNSSQEIFKKITAKYLDRYAIVYSPKRLALELIKIKKILDKLSSTTNKENILYVPDINKSYSIITYMYIKANNIKNPKVIFSQYELSRQKNKNIVVLDDMTVSGHSYINLCKKLIEDKKDLSIQDSCDFYFVPVMSTKYARNCYKKLIKKNNKSDLYTMITNGNNVKCFDDEVCKEKIPELIKKVKEEKPSDDFTQNEKNLLRKTAGEGSFGNAVTCIIMPYVIPDNSSSIASLIFSNLLYKKTSCSDKTNCIL